jgi:hypothetical protein
VCLSTGRILSCAQRCPKIMHRSRVVSLETQNDGLAQAIPQYHISIRRPLLSDSVNLNGQR